MPASAGMTIIMDKTSLKRGVIPAKAGIPFFFLLYVVSLPVFAQNTVPDCPTYPDVPVNVTPFFDAPVYDNNTPVIALQSLSGNEAYHIHETLTLGLTRYQPSFEISVPIMTTQAADGLACAYVDHVDVKVGYKDVTVYVAQEIPQNSCGFQEVAAHEQKHIAVNRAILNEFAPVIQTKIQAYLKTNGVFREENPDYALSLVREKLKTILTETASAMVAENQRRQQGVDSPAEYARISASCNGQLRAFGMQYLRGK